MQKNIITEQFRAAGKLINEWRDTIPYGAIWGAAAAGVIETNTALALTAGRETFRAAFRGYGLAWGGANDHEDILYRCKMVCAAFTVASAANTALTSATALPSSPAPVIYAGLGILSAWGAGGPHNVWNLYVQDMFNYPRKRGTPTQTEKLAKYLRARFRPATPPTP